MFPRLKTILPVFFIFGLLLVIFHPILRNFLLVPYDALAGTYYPWFDHQWGYPVAVIVKNIAISDVFAQLFPWRSVAMEALRHFQLPLWNPYSFSGTPLLANWQSAPFYPLNLLLLLFGDNLGWTLLAVSQPFLALIFTYLFLKRIGIKSISSLTGAVIFAFSGFMTTYLQYNTTGHILLWLPLLLYLFETFITTRRSWSLILIPFVSAFISLGGFFQPALYVYLLATSYLLWKFVTIKQSKSAIYILIIFFLLGLGLAGIQLLPVAELLNRSIRQLDHNIVEYGYGLLPLKNITTLFAPDFFGNPVTYNFWGFLQYQETAGYFGIVTFILIFAFIFRQYRHPLYYYLLVWFLVSLTLAYDNPLSRLIYTSQFPLLSTGYASRWYMVTGITAALMAAIGLDSLNRRLLFKYCLMALLLSIQVTAFAYASRYLFTHSLARLSPDIVASLTTISVAFRNSLLPLAFMGCLTLACLIFKNIRILSFVVLLLVSADLVRFTTKFTSFSPAHLSSDQMPVIQFLKQNLGYYRLEKEAGPLMPSNTWTNFRFSSPSGYDPLIDKNYATWYRVYNQNPLDSTNYTRYLEWVNYNSPFLDLASVKYILTLKRDKDGIFSSSGDRFYYNFPVKKFNRVFEDETVVVFENPTVMSRVSLFDQFDVQSDNKMAFQILSNGFDFHNRLVINATPSASTFKKSPTDQANIVHFEPNQVIITTNTQHSTLLLLTDTDYPGWLATIDNQPTKIYTADGVYRAIELPAGQHEVKFMYQPKSFQLGLLVTFSSLVTTLALIFILKRSKLTS